MLWRAVRPSVTLHELGCAYVSVCVCVCGNNNVYNTMHSRCCVGFALSLAKLLPPLLKNHLPVSVKATHTDTRARTETYQPRSRVSPSGSDYTHTHTVRHHSGLMHDMTSGGRFNCTRQRINPLTAAVEIAFSAYTLILISIHDLVAEPPRKC